MLQKYVYDVYILYIYICIFIYIYIYIFNSLWCFFHIHIICRYTYHLYLHTRYYMHMYVNMICVCVSKIYIFIYLFTNMWFSSPWSSNPPQNTPWFLLSRRSPTAGGSENSHTKFGVFFQRPQKKNAGSGLGFLRFGKKYPVVKQSRRLATLKVWMVFIGAGNAKPRGNGEASTFRIQFLWLVVDSTLWESFVSIFLVISEGIETWDTSVGKTLG